MRARSPHSSCATTAGRVPGTRSTGPWASDPERTATRLANVPSPMRARAAGDSQAARSHQREPTEQHADRDECHHEVDDLRMKSSEARHEIGTPKGHQSKAKKKSPTHLSVGLLLRYIPGSDLLSHAPAHAVPSAVAGLTSVFGMGTGVTLPLWPPGNLVSGVQPRAQICEPRDRSSQIISFEYPAIDRSLITHPQRASENGQASRLISIG